MRAPSQSSGETHAQTSLLSGIRDRCSDRTSRAAHYLGGFDAENALNHRQILSKYRNRAVFYDQAVDNYPYEKLTADVKPIAPMPNTGAK